jgi:hypothetical protein
LRKTNSKRKGKSSWNSEKGLMPGWYLREYGKPGKYRIDV